MLFSNVKANDLSIKVNNTNPDTNQRVWITINVDDTYRWKIYFSKIQYRNSSSGKWINDSITSSTYISDYYDDAELGYYNITASDDGKKTLSKFLKFKKDGNYRIYVEDKDWDTDYVQFFVGNSDDHNNYIKLSTNNTNPTKNESINLTINTNNYKWDLTLSTKYRSDTSSSRIDITNSTSATYYGHYSDIWEKWYYTMKSSDNGTKTISNLVEFKKEWYYKIYVNDEEWNQSYIEFHIWNTDDEVYISRSCKQYKLTYNSSLNARTSPNLTKKEYFINVDYFKRYIDSKNSQVQGCPTNKGRISTTYQDKTNHDDKYVAPNWKVYFINNQNWRYQSNELGVSSNLFSSLQEIKYYIRDRNPLIWM